MIFFISQTLKKSPFYKNLMINPSIQTVSKFGDYSGTQNLRETNR